MGGILWVRLVGVVRRYLDFLILLIPTPLVSALFCSSIPTFSSIFSCFSFFFRFFVIYVVIFSHSINTHTGDYGRPMEAVRRAAHNVLYMKKHTQTNASYPVMAISCIPSSGGV